MSGLRRITLYRRRVGPSGNNFISSGHRDRLRLLASDGCDLRHHEGSLLKPALRPIEAY